MRKNMRDIDVTVVTYK